MRPAEKGDWPQENGVNIIYTEYGEAREELMNRTGDYCSYCENQITNPHLEHEQPKSIAPGIELNWYNFLLACVSCNSSKGHHWLDVDDYYWPDIHNTHLLFDFFPLGVITVKKHLHPGVDRVKAERTFNLTGLQKYAHNTTAGDRRWIKRNEAWGKAEYALLYFEQSREPSDYMQCILDIATSTGFWSIWMKMFENHPTVQMKLIQVFNGTFKECLNTDINRNL